jgi:predicted dehydrogenase
MRAINWGIAGSGVAARSFAEGLQSLPGAHLHAVGSRRGASAFAGRFGAARHYDTIAALVADPAIDVVYIATPNSLHREHCSLALNAGKPVLCEKPFATSLAEARAVISLARERRLACIEAMWMRFLPAMSRVRKLLADGAIGDIRMLAANFGFVAPHDPANRFFNPALGGGALLDAGVYPLSLAIELLGAPTRVTGTASLGATGVDEQFAAILGYDDGRIATIAASLRATLPSDAVITGTRGEIRIAPLYRPEFVTLQAFSPPAATQEPDAQPSLRERLKGIAPLRAAVRHARWLVPARSHAPGRERIAYAGNGFNYEAAEMMRCLRAGEIESPVMPHAHTLQTLECVERIRAQWHAAGR